MTALHAPGHWWRAGAITTVALGMALGAAGTAAAAAPAASDFVVRAGALVLSSDAGHYTGTMQVTVRNTSGAEVPSADLRLTLPAGLRFLDATSAFGCRGSAPLDCGLPGFAAGETRTLTVSLGSYAGPADVARVTAPGTVAVVRNGSTPGARESAGFVGVLRSSSGSIRHPRPYRPSTAHDLALSAGGSPVVARDSDGVTVRLPVVAQDRTDAYNDGADVGATVAGVDGPVWVMTVPSEPCTSTCPVPGDPWLASGETRQFSLVVTLPATTPAGTYEVRVHGDMNVGTVTPPADRTPQDNTVAYTVTVPAA